MLLLRRVGMLSLSILLVSLSVSASAETIQLRVVGWNVESGDADTETIAGRIEDEEKVDIWGLSEVASEDDAERYEEAAEDGENADYELILGTTGRDDRLAIIYNTERLEKISVDELHWINIRGRVRAPLVAKFRGKTTGKEFLFMVNHLFRGSASGRKTQSRLLNEWAKRQSLPIIAVGDYNYDWHYQTGDEDHDAGYDLLTKDAVFWWVRPERLVPTNSSGYNSVLDFVFASGDAAGWQYRSNILAIRGDFPDTSKKSDHRPVDAIFALVTDGPGPITNPTVTHLRAAIEAMRQEVAHLSIVGRGLTQEEEQRLENLGKAEQGVVEAIELLE